ncbi:hypothetical protein JCM6882_009339 [Rhodosporidiobolus microsporus]
MGSPPIPDRSPPPRPSTSAAEDPSIPPAFRDRSPPRPHPGVRPAVAPASVPFSPPKRKTGGSLKGKERAMENADEDEEGAGWGDPDFPKQQRPTYRHLLGTNNAGPANPLRVVSLADVDAAYAAMEMARLGIPEDEPCAVQQWNGLIAVNYPARRFGITRHESPAEALKKCPHLRLVHVQTYKNGGSEPGYWEGAKPETHKVSLDMYRKESRKILAVFSEFCPVVEKASIDESYLDLTLPVRKLLLAKYPALSSAPNGDLDALLPPPSALGITSADIDWEAAGNLVPVSGQKKEKLKRLLPDGTDAPPSSSPIKPGEVSTAAADGDAVPPDEAAVAAAATEEGDASPSPDPPAEPPLTWSDLCLYLGAGVMVEIRTAVRERLGYTCSAGIASNKMLAKLTSAWKKPNAQTILRHSAVPAFLRPMPFQKIRNLGGKLGNAVKETYEAETVGDLLKLPLPELKAKLGDDSGVWLWEIVRGIDYTEVETKTQVKSMLSSKNFRPYISTYGEVLHWLNILATELHLRLTDARDLSPGLWPKTITFTHRSPQFVIRSHQAPFPYTSSPSASYILKHGEKLVRIAMGGTTPTAPSVQLPKETKIGPYSNIQLSFSGLERLEEGQRGIEGFFAAAGAMGQKPKVSSANEDVKGKKRAATPSTSSGDGGKSKKKQKLANGASSSSSAFAPIFGSSAAANNGAGVVEELTLSDTDGETDQEEAKPAAAAVDRSPPPPLPSKRVKRAPSAPSYTCARCGQVLLLPIALEDDEEEEEEGEGGGEEKVEHGLRRLEAEHADWHVARDLLDTERKKSGWGLSNNGGSKSKSAPSSSKKDKGEGGGEAAKKGGKKSKEKGTLTGFFRPKS